VECCVHHRTPIFLDCIKPRLELVRLSGVLHGCKVFAQHTRFCSNDLVGRFHISGARDCFFCGNITRCVCLYIGIMSSPDIFGFPWAWAASEKIGVWISIPDIFGLYQTEARACVFVRCDTWRQGLCTAYMILQQRLSRAVSQFRGMRLFVLRQHHGMCLLVHRYDEVDECDSKDKLPFLPRLSGHDFLSCLRGKAGLRSYRWDMHQANMWSIDGNPKRCYFVNRYADYRLSAVHS